ncbi:MULTISPECIES: hypothetical protein [unclassified Streptomyces]|uniref:hypothetical protein n=1 Tax=unclassified Streptomyces TaxID=2593676 RepID=UPI0022581C3E|nr:hypothetical protein [Streptomyces sp. NBC_01264]MCX4784131.1 hypothetical protein [Streptomyces sp. NBC_01264]
MSCPTHSVAQTFPHRWCTLLGRTVIVAGLLPALFGGATAVMLLALAALAALGLLMVAGAFSARRSAKPGVRPGRAVAALTADVLVLLVAAGLLIGALIGGSGASILSSPHGLAVVAGFLALCAVHHLTHRRSRRSRRRSRR